MMAKFHRVLDSMVGVHLNAHVMGVCSGSDLLASRKFMMKLGGYEFLMQNCTLQVVFVE
jgi:hypothetical protein